MYVDEVDDTPTRHLRRLCTEAPELLDASGL